MKESQSKIILKLLILTIQTDKKNAQNIEKQNTGECVSLSIVVWAGKTYRQKTALTTRGMFFDGFSVSPAVIPKLSVPPSSKIYVLMRSERSDWLQLTSKTSGHEHLRETTKATNKRCSRYIPVMAPDIVMIMVNTNVDQNTKNDEYDDCNNFKGSEPVFCTNEFEHLNCRECDTNLLLTKFSIRFYMHRVDPNKKDPEEQADDP